MGVLEKVNERRTSDHALNDAANIRHELKAGIVDSESESCISPKAENRALTFHSLDPLTSTRRKRPLNACFTASTVWGR